MENALINKGGLPLWTQAQLQSAMVEALYKQGLLTEEQRRGVRERLGCDMLDNEKEN